MMCSLNLGSLLTLALVLTISSDVFSQIPTRPADRPAPRPTPNATPAPKVSKAEVEVIWEGSGLVKIEIDKEEYVFSAGERKSLSLKIEELLSLSVILPSTRYTAEEFLRITKDGGYLVVNINKDNRIVVFEYESLSDRQARQREAEEAQRAEVEKFRRLFEMVRVDGGSFTMGCQDGRDKDCFDWEKPARTVQVSSFSIGKYEVTQAQWRAVMGSDPEELYNKGCDNCPVEQVSWNDTQEFIQKLNSLTGERYRLPTEAEWEYAARGGNKSKGYLYSGSHNIDEVAWYDGNYKQGNIHGSEKTTRPVGGKKPNELGLYDMSGNVWEWCEDDGHESYSVAPTDARAWVDNPRASNRVVRGGGWFRNARLCRAAYRNGHTPADRYGNVGFRLAL
jgi:formylglycine-generating enzyme required for sulfatase activity